MVFPRWTKDRWRVVKVPGQPYTPKAPSGASGNCCCLAEVRILELEATGDACQLEPFVLAAREFIHLVQQRDDLVKVALGLALGHVVASLGNQLVVASLDLGVGHGVLLGFLYLQIWPR